MMKRSLLVLGIAIALMAGPPSKTVHANELIAAIGDIVSGALSIPTGVLAGTIGGPPVIGTISGALFGTLNAVSLTTRGALRLVGVAIPLAARLAPLLPIFL